MSNDFAAAMLGLGAGEKVREEYARAPFPWPGGKSKGLENILPWLPYRNTYIEPFGGSGAVLLARNESPLEVYNDRFGGVTCFYRVLANPISRDQLLDRLTFFLHSREEFIWCKQTWKNVEDEIERAARWWYMVTVSFSAQGRNFGRCISGKAQMGPKLKNNLEHFAPVSRRLRNVQIENQDWRGIFQDFDREDVVWYLDPPYYKVYQGMYECELSEQDHIELIERAFNLKGFVAISGYSNELYDRYKWSHKKQWRSFLYSDSLAETETNNRTDGQRGYRYETLWIKE